MRLKKMTSLAGAFTVLGGCSNALYFYETETISMSLEGRPDSSQPVQGSLGLKQRVAVVAPPKDPDTMTKARSDSVSMISTFRFRKDKGGFADLGPVTIQTALVTGSAATGLKDIEAQAVAAVQVTGETIPTEGKLADEIVSGLKKPELQKELERLKVLLQTTRCKELSPDQKKEYERLTDVARYRETLCNAVSKRLEAEP